MKVMMVNRSYKTLLVLLTCRCYQSIVGEEYDRLHWAAVVHGGDRAAVAVPAGVPDLDGVIVGAGHEEGGGAAGGTTGPDIILKVQIKAYMFYA